MELRMPVATQTTLHTVEDYIADARVLLLDQISPFRYDDSSLITSLNVTLLETRRLRPDLFVFHREWGERVPSYNPTQPPDNTVVPIEPQFRLAVLHGLIGHALERDQEDVQDERATSFLNIMSNILTGKNMIEAPKGV